MLPRDVVCPECAAKIGQGCHSKGKPWFSARTHMKRWHAIGIHEPTDNQRHADYEDGVERDFKIRERVFRELRERFSRA